MVEIAPSQRSTEKAYIRFVNLTQRKVQIIWISFSGSYVKYETLDKGKYLDVNTFEKHTWIAIDEVTMDRLHIEKKFVYSPKSTREYFKERLKREVPQGFDFRIPVAITTPLRTLKYNSLLAVRNNLRDPEEVDALKLPKALQGDLKRAIHCRNYQRQIEF